MSDLVVRVIEDTGVDDTGGLVEICENREGKGVRIIIVSKNGGTTYTNEILYLNDLMLLRKALNIFLHGVVL